MISFSKMQSLSAAVAVWLKSGWSKYWRSLGLAVWLFSGAVQAQGIQNYVGFWWKASESGWGMSVQQQGSRAFAVWYTYDTAGAPIWYVLDCNFVGTVCAADLLTGTGTPFSQLTASTGANPSIRAVGKGSLTGTANNRLSLSYTIGNVTQTKADLEPYLISSNVPVCTLQSGSRAGATNFTDKWWGGPALSGWGMQITHQGSRMFLGWYGYNDARNAAWYVGEGDQDPQNPKRFTGSLYDVASGPAFSNFTSANPTAARLGGTYAIIFSDGEKGSFTYTLTGSTAKTLPIERFLTSTGTTNLCKDVVAMPISQPDASRFLAQATFGPNMTEIDQLSRLGFDAWLTTQFAMPQTLHMPNVVAYQSTLAAADQRGQLAFYWSLWKSFATGNDVLRQRVAFALSQFFVISVDSNLSFNFPRGPANYLDQLGANAFGNYREILEKVTYSPMMGIYLSALKNSKEDPVTGAVPDENYAREVMQLFSIGLYQLNIDGSQKLGADGKPLETYSNADITGLAKVFTGLSFGGADTSDNRYRGNLTGRDPNYDLIPMQAYARYHSIAEKKFLTATIPAQTLATADVNGDVKIALDTLFNHANVGPFVGKQLIQRLVTANPSPAYIARVATAFNNNGSGIRGDMKAVIRAVLLDQEARNTGVLNQSSGKLREPVVRLVQWMRAFNAKSADGRFLLTILADPSAQLAQSPMRSPSVFNFFRPQYVPPNSRIGTAGLLSPEAQITSETSVAGYANFMRSVVSTGIGASTNNVRDILPDYSAELALANNPDALVDRINLLLTAGSLSASTRNSIRDAVASVAIGANNPDGDRRNRVFMAIYLTMVSPDYIVQQ